MQKAFILGLGLMAVSAMPAVADGYENAPAPNRGPDPLAPHAQQTYQYEHEKHVVYEPEVTYTSSSCCCCAPVTYGHTYVTEPVTVRRYTRTYTRLAPPDCYHGYSHKHRHHHDYEESRYSDYDREVSYSSGPVYRENSVIWSSEASYDGYQSWHNDRADPWAHYDRGWRN